MKKPTKAKATPTPKAEPETYYAIEVFYNGEINSLASCNSIEDAEQEIIDYLEDENDGGNFIIVKQVKAIHAARKIDLIEDNSIRINQFNSIACCEEDEE